MVFSTGYQANLGVISGLCSAGDTIVHVPDAATVYTGDILFVEATRMAGKGNLVLTGHIHAPFAMPYGFGDGRTYAVGAGTLSIRERGVPPSFNRIEIDGGCIRVTALAWTGARYEPFRTWAVDKR